MSILPFAGNRVRRLKTALDSLTQRIRAGIHGTTTAAIDMLLPAACLLCGEDLIAPTARPFLCRDCRQTLCQESVTRCGRCAARIALPASQDGCRLCHDARLKFDRALTLGSYETAIRDVVLRMKHWRQDSLSRAVAELLTESLHAELAAWPVDVVVAVPMHWRRRIVRSTNSSELVAETIARRLQRPLSRRSLKRARATRPQGTLSPRERRQNVRDAFRVARGSDWRGAKVLLVDDILTTGATCSEIARVLKDAGAAEVNVVVVARAQGHL